MRAQSTCLCSLLRAAPGDVAMVVVPFYRLGNCEEMRKNYTPWVLHQGAAGPGCQPCSPRCSQTSLPAPWPAPAPPVGTACATGGDSTSHRWGLGLPGQGFRKSSAGWLWLRLSPGYLSGHPRCHTHTHSVTRTPAGWCPGAHTQPHHKAGNFHCAARWVHLPRGEREPPWVSVPRDPRGSTSSPATHSLALAVVAQEPSCPSLGHVCWGGCCPLSGALPPLPARVLAFSTVWC